MDIFKDKVAIVTGAASGIGRSLAEQMAQRGAKVVMADVDSGLLAEAVESIKKSGGSAKAVTLDVSDRGAVQKMVDETVSKHGRVDYLFNNAGIGIGGEARDFTYDDWKRVIDINLYGTVNGVFAAYPVMLKQGSGHIINTASMAGLVPFPAEISYTTSKYAIVGLSHALRAEGRALGVKVSVVCPGKIETPIYETSKLVGFDREKAFGMLPKGITPEKCAAIILRGVEKNKATIVVTMLAKAVWLLGRLSQSLIHLIARIYIRVMRTARLEEDK